MSGENGCSWNLFRGALAGECRLLRWLRADRERRLSCILSHEARQRQPTTFFRHNHSQSMRSVSSDLLLDLEGLGPLLTLGERASSATRHSQPPADDQIGKLCTRCSKQTATWSTSAHSPLFYKPKLEDEFDAPPLTQFWMLVTVMCACCLPIFFDFENSFCLTNSFLQNIEARLPGRSGRAPNQRRVRLSDFSASTICFGPEQC